MVTSNTWGHRMRRPVSSNISLTTAASQVSPNSTWPPGRAQVPGSVLRWSREKRFRKKLYNHTASDPRYWNPTHGAALHKQHLAACVEHESANTDTREILPRNQLSLRHIHNMGGRSTLKKANGNYRPYIKHTTCTRWEKCGCSIAKTEPQPMPCHSLSL